jgi:hypothetical protein
MVPITSLNYSCSELLPLLTPVPPKSWAWNHFYTDGKKYKNNKTDPNAWCNACLVSKMADLRESDSVAAANGLLAHGRSEDELQTEGEGLSVSAYSIELIGLLMQH